MKRHAASLLILLVAAIFAAGTSQVPEEPPETSDELATEQCVIENEAKASADDVEMAKTLVADLSSECTCSSASAADDGTITLVLDCANDLADMQMTFTIKDLDVTQSE